MKLLQKKLSLIALCFVLATQSQALDLSGKFGIGAEGGLAIPMGEDIIENGFDSGFTAGGYLRYYFNNNFGTELSYDFISLKEKDPLTGTGKGHAINLNLVYRMMKGQFSPVLKLGAGMGMLENSTLNYDESGMLSLKAALGFDYFFTDAFSMGLYGNFHHLTKKDTLLKNAQTVNPVLSLTYYFGMGSGGSSSTDSDDEPSDSDGDGVPDKFDHCPGTSSGSNVNSSGCEESTTTMSDSDNDGISDDMDQCPGTPAGHSVNSAGCHSKQNIKVKLNILFDSGKSAIKSSFHDEIAKVADIMNTYSDTSAEIGGHTDSMGSDALNQAISEKRANAVRDYLVNNFGIDSSRLSARGYGESSPIASNKTRAGRAQNRRTVAIITGTK